MGRRYEDLVFVSFGTGPEWVQATCRLENSIIKNFPGASVFIKNQNWLYGSELYINNKEFYSKFKEGFGLWTWKPLLIKEAFAYFPEARYFIYLDVGCELNMNPISQGRFEEYLNFTNEKGALAFETGYFEVDFTSKFTLNALEFQDNSQIQIAATAIFFRNTSYVNQFVDEWLSAMTKDNFSLTVGENNVENSSKFFSEHRHDQSVLSLLWRRTSFGILKNELYWGPNWEDGKEFPIFATRNRLYVAQSSNFFIKIFFRLLRRILIVLTMRSYTVV